MQLLHDEEKDVSCGRLTLVTFDLIHLVKRMKCSRTTHMALYVLCSPKAFENCVEFDRNVENV